MKTSLRFFRDIFVIFLMSFLVFFVSWCWLLLKSFKHQNTKNTKKEIAEKPSPAGTIQMKFFSDLKKTKFKTGNLIHLFDTSIFSLSMTTLAPQGVLAGFSRAPHSTRLQAGWKSITIKYLERASARLAEGFSKNAALKLLKSGAKAPLKLFFKRSLFTLPEGRCYEESG